MNEPSDGIAEEVERQLQLALAAAIAARRAIAARQHAIEQARHQSEQAAQAMRKQIDAERRLSAAQLQPVFDPGWWETAAPQDVADMWQQANTWRDPDRDPTTPMIFDRAARQIRHEVRDRAGLDPTQVLALTAVQELEREHQATIAKPVSQPAELDATGPNWPPHVSSMIPSAASSSEPDSSPQACPSPRSRLGRSPTSDKP